MDEQPRVVAGEANTMKCEGCGGRLVFHPERQDLKCIYCGSEKGIEHTKAQVVELDIEHLGSMDFNWSVRKLTIHCDACGGESLVESNDETQYCAYCGSQHLIKRDETNMGMRPQGVLPYRLNQDLAKAKLKTWIHKRHFAPSKLKQFYLGQQLQGVYMPYWTYDADTYTDYNCQVGTYYYVGTGDKRRRQTRWRRHSGQDQRWFDDVLVAGVTHEQMQYIKKIEPYNLQDVLDYKPDYLAGFFAQKYTVMPDVGILSAKQIMESEISAGIKSRLPGDTYRSYNQSVTYSNMTFKHLLLPVYLMSYRYHEKIYHVAINGQSGAVSGQAPLSPIKVGGAILGGILLALMIYLLLNN